MTFSQKYEENALANKFNEDLYRIKLAKVISALQTNEFKYYNTVMDFLENDCLDILNEVYRLNNEIEENNDKFDREEKEHEDYIDELLDRIEELQE